MPRIYKKRGSTIKAKIALEAIKEKKAVQEHVVSIVFQQAKSLHGKRNSRKNAVKFLKMKNQKIIKKR
jgi:hypothetical protein